MAVKIKNLMMFVLLCSLFLLSGCGADDAQAAANPVNENPTASPTETSQPVESEPKVTNNEVSTQPTQPKQITFDIDMYDSYYGDQDNNMTEPPVWTAPSGTTIIVNLMNHGSESHNWAIVKAGTEVPIPYEAGRESEILLVEPGMVYANSQTQWVIRAPDPNEYEIICTVSGHFPFMRGKLVITQ